MGAVNSVNDSICDDFLKCHICLEVFKDPRILPCLHTYCFRCISTYFNTVQSEGRPCVCPECREPMPDVTSLRTNFFISGLIDVVRVKSVQNVKCTACSLREKESPARVKCLDCGDFLCSSCSDGHNASSQTWNHEKLALDDIREGKYDDKLRTRQRIKCVKHQDKDVEYYCESCSQPVCLNCLLISHKEHKCQTVSHAIVHKKASIISQAEKIKGSLSILKREEEKVLSFIGVMKRKKEKRVAEIEHGYQLEIARINAKRDAELSNVSKQTKEAETSENNRLGEIRAEESVVRKCLDFCNKILEKGKDEEILMLENLITDRLKWIQGRNNMSAQTLQLTEKTKPKSGTGESDDQPIGVPHISPIGEVVLDGQSTVTVPRESPSVGQYSAAMPQDSISVGQPSASIAQDSISVGQPSASIPQDSISVGQPNTSMPQDSISVGQPNASMPQDSISVGQPNASMPQDSISVGETNACVPQKLSDVDHSNDCTSTISSSKSKTHTSSTSREDSVSLSTILEKFESSYKNMCVPKVGNTQIKVKLNLVTFFITQFASDLKTPDIKGFAFGRNVGLVLSDKANRKVKIFSTSGALKQEIALANFTPFAVAVTREVIGVVNENCLCLLNLSGKLMHKIQLHNSKPDSRKSFTYALAAWDDGFIVGNIPRENRLRHYDISGTLVKTIDCHVRSPLACLSHTPAGHVAMCEWGGACVRILSHQSQVQAKCYRTQNWKPSGVCVSTEGIIFVADFDYGGVSMFNQDGTHLLDHRTVHEGVMRPCYTTLDDDGRLYVIGKNGYTSVYQVDISSV